MKANSQQFIQKRRFYLILPVLVVPFLTMFFWALGGGQGQVNEKEKFTIGLNLSLPSPHFSGEANTWDKLSLYQKARKDSLEAGQAKRNDPYFRLSRLKSKGDTIPPDTLKKRALQTALGGSADTDEAEAKVYRKLEQLQKQIDNPNTKGMGEKQSSATQPANDKPSTLASDIDRLESMMLMMQEGRQEDSEMQEINDVLNKILDVQHPERVKSRLDKARPVSQGLYAEPSAGLSSISILGHPNQEERISNRFYGLDDDVTPLAAQNAIKAEVYGSQNLVSGSIVKLILLQDISLSGVTIPKNTFVFGECSLTQERLTVQVNSLHSNNSIYPVALTVFDIDGIEGIYVPGAIARDAAKQSSNETLQSIQLNSLDPSLEAQAATAGIEAAKGMLSKKTRLIQVNAKAGYKVFLVNKNNRSK